MDRDHERFCLPDLARNHLAPVCLCSPNRLGDVRTSFRSQHRRIEKHGAAENVDSTRLDRTGCDLTLAFLQGPKRCCPECLRNNFRQIWLSDVMVDIPIHSEWKPWAPLSAPDSGGNSIVRLAGFWARHTVLYGAGLWSARALQGCIHDETSKARDESRRTLGFDAAFEWEQTG